MTTKFRIEIERANTLIPDIATMIGMHNSGHRHMDLFVFKAYFQSLKSIAPTRYKELEIKDIKEGVIAVYDQGKHVCSIEESKYFHLVEESNTGIHYPAKR